MSKEQELKDKELVKAAEDLMDCKILSVPKDTKFVITIAEDKTNNQFLLDLLNTTDDLNMEETYNALQDIFENLTDIIEVLEFHIEEKKRALTKEEIKRKIKIVK